MSAARLETAPYKYGYNCAFGKPHASVWLRAHVDNNTASVVLSISRILIIRGGIRLTGILNVLKPPGMTSFDVVARLRRQLNVKKAGHCGTLDPGAAGVLPVCVGTATGVTGLLTESDKAYRVEAICGLRTDTLDISGAVLDRRDEIMPERERFETALTAFLGAGTQLPPMFSAVKAGGQKLYKLARKGIETERTPRSIVIYALKTVYYGRKRVIFDVECSKGTYIRSLCLDIGEYLGLNLCVSFLLRTRSAGFYLNDALPLAEIEERARAGAADDLLIPADTLFTTYPEIRLIENQYSAYMNGASVILRESYAEASGDAAQNVRVYYENRFLGLGMLSLDETRATRLRVKKFL